LHADYIPTSKNQPCLAFLQRSGLAKKDGATIFDWDLRQDYAKPSAVMLVFEAADQVPSTHLNPGRASLLSRA
jgi:hypothetical protein